jgi:ribosomal 50S subunit-recycling heat shock protein
MRLDKFLKVSRLIKRRTVANDVSEQGRVLINGNPAKPAKQVNTGDILTILFSGGELTVKILKVPSGNISVQQASELYEIIDNKH